MHEISNLRRWVAFHSQGAVRLFLGVNDQLDDVRGALTAGQREVAALTARQVLLVCLSIRGMETSGEPFTCGDDLAFDPFAGTDQKDVEEAMTLADEILDAGSGDWPDWYNRLCGFVAQTAHRLGYDNPMRSLAGLRRPRLDLARRWLAPTEALRLPLPIR